MEKIYKSKYKVTDVETYLVFGVPLLMLFFIISAIVPNPHYSLKEKLLHMVILFIGFGFVEFIGVYFSKVTAIIKDDGIIWKTICGSAYIPWDEIKKVERFWGGFYGVAHRIIAKRRTLYIPGTIDYRDVIKEIKKYTKKGARWGL